MRQPYLFSCIVHQMQGFKPLIDAGQVQFKAVDACRSYLALPHFNRVRCGGCRELLVVPCWRWLRSTATAPWVRDS